MPLFIDKAPAELDGSGEDILYYVNELKKAALSDKNIIIMDYNYIICLTIDALLKAPGQYNFCSWGFFTFFHADTTPSNDKSHEMYNASDDKYRILWELTQFPFLFKYTIPAGHNVTYDEIKELKDYFKPREDIESLEELFRNPKKPLFPYYEADHNTLMALIKKEQGNSLQEKTES